MRLIFYVAESQLEQILNSKILTGVLVHNSGRMILAMISSGQITMSISRGPMQMVGGFKSTLNYHLRNIQS